MARADSVRRIAELEDSLAVVTEKSQKWERIARSERLAKSQAEAAATRLAAELESARVEAKMAIRLAESTQRAHDRLLDVVGDLHKQLSRQPEVVVESLLTGIAPLFIGYQQDSVDNSRLQAVVTSMGAQGLDDQAGTRGYFPDIEFDESMEAREKWPTTNEMSAQTLPGSRQTATVDAEHEMANGGVARKDGQTMFTSGSGATSPPVNAVE